MPHDAQQGAEIDRLLDALEQAASDAASVRQLVAQLRIQLQRRADESTVPTPTPAGSIAIAVLVVDDHADTREVISLLLESIGCTVVAASSVADALALAELRPFDLVLSDIGLPDGDGVELMQQLKARFSLRGIALTGYGMDDDVARFRDAGFEAHLLKPVTLAGMEEAIRRVLGR